MDSQDSFGYVSKPYMLQFLNKDQSGTSMGSPGSGPNPPDSPSIDRASISMCSSGSTDFKSSAAGSYRSADLSPYDLSALEEPGFNTRGNDQNPLIDADVAGPSERRTNIKPKNVAQKRSEAELELTDQKVVGQEQQDDGVQETCLSVVATTSSLHLPLKPPSDVDSITSSLSKVTHTDKGIKKKKLLLPRQRAMEPKDSTTDESLPSTLERPPKRNSKGGIKMEQSSLDSDGPVDSPTVAPAAVASPSVITEQPRLSLPSPFPSQVPDEGTTNPANPSDYLSPPFTPQVKEEGSAEPITEPLPPSNFFFGAANAMSVVMPPSPMKSPKEDGPTSAEKKKR